MIRDTINYTMKVTSVQHLTRVDITLSHNLTVEQLTTLSITPRDVTLQCPIPTLVFEIHVECNPQRKLAVVYPNGKDTKMVKFNELLRSSAHRDLVVELPVNYRPPSDYGKDIPCSSNLYNVDPLEIYTSKAKKQLLGCDNGEPKLCRVNITKPTCSITSCSYTDEGILSEQGSINSDCIKMVYRQHSATSFTPRLVFTEFGKPDEEVRHPFHLREVNGRTSLDVYQVTSDGYMLSANCNYTECLIFFRGSELYHLEITIVEGTICIYRTDLLVYVMAPPMTRSYTNLLSVLVVLAMIAAIFTYCWTTGK